MCGRYTVRADAATFADRFGVAPAEELVGRVNVCPTEQVAAVTVEGAASLRWGLVPSWYALRGKRPLINARDDKLRSSGAWRGLVSSSATRCLVLADGWLEWQRAEDPKQPRTPWLHELEGAAPFAFAGLWCTATPRDGDGPLSSCTIVTVTANREARVLHDRMPAVLAGPEEEAAWLDPSVRLDDALALVRSLPDGSVRARPVSPRLNRAGVEGLELVA
jgi:putative SOS response-associated peptidase YedK